MTQCSSLDTNQESTMKEITSTHGAECRKPFWEGWQAGQDNLLWKLNVVMSSLNLICVCLCHHSALLLLEAFQLSSWTAALRKSNLNTLGTWGCVSDICLQPNYRAYKLFYTVLCWWTLDFAIVVLAHFRIQWDIRSSLGPERKLPTGKIEQCQISHYWKR